MKIGNHNIKLQMDTQRVCDRVGIFGVWSRIGLDNAADQGLK